MEENNTQKQIEKENKKQQKLNFTNVMSFISYIGIGFIAVALLLTLIFKGDTSVALICRHVGEVIAYSISIFLAFLWVKSHQKVGWIVCYVVFVVTILVLFILTV